MMRTSRSVAGDVGHEKAWKYAATKPLARAMVTQAEVVARCKG
jgi:hypothetical protein